MTFKAFLRSRENKQLLERINAAYADGLTFEEETVLRKMRRKQAHTLEDKW